MTLNTIKSKLFQLASFLILCGFAFAGMPVHAEGEAAAWGAHTATVMIDPGHGGMDSGAIAFNGQYEKDLTLDYALRIGGYIEALDPSIAVVYTRTDDSVNWVDEAAAMNFELDDLNGRCAMVNAVCPDYVLCLHFNSAPDPAASGYEAFVKEGDVASAQVYGLMSEKLAQAGYSYDLGLLSTTECPLQMVDLVNSSSMLLELGFLSNEGDLYALNDEGMKDSLCRSIAESYVETIYGAYAYY